jgi:nicotinamide-nucleotide amidase
LSHPGQVDLRITAKAASQEVAERLIEPLEREARELLGHHVFAHDDQTMQDVVGGLLHSNGNWTVASYEGLTGGLVAQYLQEAAGRLFVQGIIGRDEFALRQILEAINDAEYSDLVEDGARLADRLAAAVKARSGADFGIAIHGVPDDANVTQNLSAGQTYISVCSASGTKRRVYNFAGPGLPDRTRTAIHSLDLLRVTILESQ